METHRKVRDYKSAAFCKHNGPRRLLGNGEYACDQCMHVCQRRDGTVPKYTYAAPGIELEPLPHPDILP